MRDMFKYRGMQHGVLENPHFEAERESTTQKRASEADVDISLQVQGIGNNFMSQTGFSNEGFC